MKKKKYRLKKKVKIFLLVLLMLIIGIVALLIYLNTKPKENKTSKNKTSSVEPLITKIKEDSITQDFIDYVDKNYSGSIDKLEKLLENNEYNRNMWHEATGNSYIVLNDLYNKKYDKMDNIKILDNKETSTLTFVGDISLADNWRIIPKYDSRGKGIKGVLSDDILNIMTNTDVMVANSEFTVSERGTAIPDKQYTFRAKPERLKIYDEMGVDLVTLANNHVYDYGRDAFLDMLDAFKEYKIPNIGAGHNKEEAEKEYYFVVNGYKIGFLSASRAEKYQLTPGATDNSEGIFLCYDPTNMINRIKEVKENSDYVVAIIHFGWEDHHELEPEQISSAREYINAGADMVVGHHAHTLQGVEMYNDKPIIYNLGNFLFNQATVETALFQVQLHDDGTMDYYMIPALQKDCFTDTAGGQLKQKIINDLNSWSQYAQIDENGKISKK